MNQSNDKAFIISEIIRTSKDNDNVPLGQGKFEEATGISRSKWRGKYWRNWSDALTEAGFEPNKPRERTDDSTLIQRLAELTQKLGFFPTYADMRLECHDDNTFPTHQLFNRLGSQDVRLELLRDYAKSNEVFSKILDFLPEPKAIIDNESQAKNKLTEGFVYLALLKLGNQKRYKIGKAVLTARRIDQISIQLPEDLTLEHYIKTDDAFGIEKYWHNRFAKQNTKGEWFELSNDDIRAFKKRNFM